MLYAYFMKIDESILRTVVFIGFEKKDGSVELIGTGFIVGYPSKIVENWNYTYLVTARHVPAGLGNGSFIVRANTKEGNYMDFKGEHAAWHFHPSDTSVDVAIAKINFGEDHDYRMIGTDLFLTDETIKEQNIGTGDDVFFPGLFSLLKTEKNLPILRMGNLALMNPGRVVPTKSFGNIEAFLVEARSIGGLSGSPVFVRNSNLFQRKISLLGLMHGHWDVPEQQVQIVEDANLITSNKVNMGIAIVVPASKIMETLEHSALAIQREALDNAELQSGRKAKIMPIDESKLS